MGILPFWRVNTHTYYYNYFASTRKNLKVDRRARMNLLRILGIVMISVGIVLLIFGIIATQKTGEEMFQTIVGRYTRETMWYIIGGIALVIGGGLCCFNRRRR